ncbi:hypothetical protein GTP81_24765 [Rugamonas sp. FT107W]|uniref:PAAR domain-containing protein n=1 Tax=Duganella vulcania TaxID=2692166 RepID=A0A845HMJ5_9BURK|nr:PAAR domain-containing protein [Duganella vulcania]MYN19960.1 hypothetical protein [Duganella vulcania]
MRKIICVGDPTTHGGKVISSSAPHFTVDGKAVACIGDKCSCPIIGHGGVCTIVEGDDQHTIDGRPVVYEGHKTSCGATVLADGADKLFQS